LPCFGQKLADEREPLTVLFAMLAAVILVGVVVTIYPGELSYVSHPLHRWLYDRGARRYERKWRSPSYQDPAIGDLIARHARTGCDGAGRREVLDLGCGTGRATRLVAEALPGDTQFVAVDFAPAMLRCFKEWLGRHADPGVRSRIDIVERDLGEWLRSSDAERAFGAVLMLEVAEFLGRPASVLRGIASVTAPAGALIMTRPAGLWWLLFPGRHQSRPALARALAAAGFGDLRFVPWRGRYELVLATRDHRPRPGASV
jgi:SAM-dependent methyltransferase